MINYTLTSSYDQIIHESEAMVSVLKSVDKVAKYSTNVLITGESGTGKELIARALHNKSPRKSNPFLAMNCGALPDTLLESELFGYEKGAFTGSIREMKGKFELAEGGTLFLDEVGVLSQSAQVTLLRVIQEREIVRLGGMKTIPFDVRIVAATNRDLKEAVKDGKFREDLFHRLYVFPVQIPPLRKRIEDIPLLIEYFRLKFNKERGLSISYVSDDVKAILSKYPWPGNVRELKNLMERIMIIIDGDTIAIKDIPPEYFPGSQSKNVSVPILNEEVQKFGDICAAILKQEVQALWQLEIMAKKLGIWPKGRGVAGLGRKLIKICEQGELFKRFDRENMKVIFDLLNTNASFKKEQSEKVKRLLNIWPTEIA